jgi:hypothetical protein
VPLASPVAPATPVAPASPASVLFTATPVARKQRESFTIVAIALQQRFAWLLASVDAATQTKPEAQSLSFVAPGSLGSFRL